MDENKSNQHESVNQQQTNELQSDPQVRVEQQTPLDNNSVANDSTANDLGSQLPQGRNQQQILQPNLQDSRALRSAQSKITFAYIAGPLSLFIGGMLLGVIGLICAGLAYKKLGVLQHKEQTIAQNASELKRSAKVALIICGVAFALNAVSMYLMFPIILEMMQSGQYGAAVGSLGAGTSAGTSAWG